MGIIIKFPKPTSQNTFRLTLYTLAAGALFFLLSAKSSSPFAEDTINNLTDQAASSPEWQLYLMGGLLLLFILGGIITITIYVFLLSHQSKLKKPQTAFKFFYFAFILWLALFFSIELFIRLLALILNTPVSDLTAILISILLTLLINSIAVFLMHRYMGGQQSLISWLKKLILPNKKSGSIKKLIFWGIAAYIGFIPLIIAGSLANQYILNLTGKNFPPQQLIEFSLSNHSLPITILLFLLITIIAPFFEEIIMRGLVFRGLLRISCASAAIIFSGIIFALFHFNIYAFLPIALIGILLAWLYNRTGSLIPPMIAHALFNGLNFLLMEVLKVV